MLAEFIDTSSWSPEQWLAAIILAFIVVTILVVLKRIVGLFKLSQKSRYKPNLRPLRRTSHRPSDQ